MPEKRERLGVLLKDLAESTSIHGIPKIATAKPAFQKVLWSILLAAVSAYLCYQLNLLFTAYYKWPLKTSVSLQFNKLQFPAITICNMNPIKKDQLVLAQSNLRTILNPTKANKVRRKKRSASSSSSSSASGTSDISSSVITSTPVQTVSPSIEITPSPALSPTPLSSTDASSVSSAYADSWSFLYDSSIYSSYYSSSPTYDHSSDSYMYSSYSQYYSSYDYYYASDEWEAPKNTWQARIEAFKNAYINESKESRDKMGHSLDDMLMSCSFATKNCYAENFTHINTADYGNCYTLTNDKFITRRTGPLYGMWLTLNLEVNEYITNFAAAYGIRLVIHEPGTYPFPSEEGITLSPGYETTIGIKMINVSRLGKPYGKCNDGIDFHKNFGIRYTIPACVQLCKQQWVIETCGCRPTTSGIIDIEERDDVESDDFTTCTSDNLDDLCQKVVEAKYERGDMECRCDSPCREILYTKTISGRDWPNDEYLRYALMVDMCAKNLTYMADECLLFNKNPSSYDLKQFQKNFLNTMLYYEDLNYEFIEEEPLYDQFRFLSDIGGTLGLFVGASILSFAEIFHVLLVLLNHVRKKIGFVNVSRVNVQQDKEGAGGDVEDQTTPPPAYPGVRQRRNSDSAISTTVFN